MALRPIDRPLQNSLPPTTTAQLLVQIPFSDTFQASRDHFMPGHGRRESSGHARGWHRRHVCGYLISDQIIARDTGSVDTAIFLPLDRV